MLTNLAQIRPSLLSRRGFASPRAWFHISLRFNWMGGKRGWNSSKPCLRCPRLYRKCARPPTLLSVSDSDSPDSTPMEFVFKPQLLIEPPYSLAPQENFAPPEARCLLLPLFTKHCDFPERATHRNPIPIAAPSCLRGVASSRKLSG